jgi:hypothetical protein
MHTEPRGMVTDTLYQTHPQVALLAPHKQSYSRWRLRWGGSLPPPEQTFL